MKVARRLCSVLAIALLVGTVAPQGVVASAGRAAQGAPEYRVIRPTGPAGDPLEGILTLNQRGQVLGNIWPETGAPAAVVWDGRTTRSTYVAPWWASWQVSPCPPYTTQASAQDISNEGHVVGGNGWPACPPYIYVAPWLPRSTAFTWQNGTWLDLTYGPGQGSSALAVNDRGLVVGYEAVSGGIGPYGGTVFAWQNGQRLTVPRLLWAMRPWDLNNRGQVLLGGTTVEEQPRSGLMIWDTGSGAVTEVDLDLPPDTGVASAGINERGQVIVSATTIGAGPLAALTYLWDGEQVDFGDPGLGVVSRQDGRDDYNRNSKPLNDLGHVVLQGTTAGGEQHAFLWRDGEATDLGTLGGDHSVGYAVNNHDEVVGQSRTADGKLHAFLWRRGQMTDLGVLAGEEGHTNATQINDAGDIVGSLTRPYPDFPPAEFTYQLLFWTRT